MLFGGKHAADGTVSAVGLEQQSPSRRRERSAGKVSPAVPTWVVRIGRRPSGDADVLHQAFEVVAVFAQAARSAISFLVSAIALAGLRPLGQTFAQFMIVWHR